MVGDPVASKRLWGEQTGGNQATKVTTKVFLSEIRGMTQEQNAQRALRGKFTVQRRAGKRERMLICLLTVLGLVRFLASVSQLLRWLYVLLLQWHQQKHGYCDNRHT